MKTSNFSRSGSDPWAVAISRTQPKGWKGRVYEELAPSWQLLNMVKMAGKRLDPKEYACRYREEVLSSLDAQKVFDDLDEDAILLCWEKPGAFCHRRLVAEWLEEELGISVPEVKSSGDAGQRKLIEW